MARKLRVQFRGALYHVFNRGNYRHDVFRGRAAGAFAKTIAEVTERYRWRLHAFVVMRNHYHLAVETPEPNLVEGMHWLQCTFATRFNRLRGERGHLFQGRYHALLVENDAALVRVINYIHLNPVRAKVVASDSCAQFPWSSLPLFLRVLPDSWLCSETLRSVLGFSNSPKGWSWYRRYLAELAKDLAEQERQGFAAMTSGWAIGTSGWRRTVAKELLQLALQPGLEAAELRTRKNDLWEEQLHKMLADHGKTSHDIREDPPNASWKTEFAVMLRTHGAPFRWIAGALNMGPSTSAIRGLLFRRRERRTA